MNDPDFNRLLNSFLDGELSGEALEHFRRALRESPHRRAVFRQSLILQKAQRALVNRWSIRDFIVGGLRNFSRRSLVMLANAVVFVFVLSAYQNQGPRGIDAEFPLPATSGIVEPQHPVSANRDAKEVRASATLSDSEGEMEFGPADTDFYSPFPDEEYGFVRL
ncbi:MAG: hypothetical protein LBD01_01365 [Puniceicoccales bacterium]|jgi:hypothetical protein|nr:hypothetical protein [Puniceicoccales bacterium]